MLILIDDLDQSVTAKGETTWERFVSHVRAARLDRDIATGASPDSNAFLALLALALVQPCDVADAGARIPAPGGRGADNSALRRLDPRIPIQRDSILDAADALQMLIDRLLMAAPVPARGVAQALLLLTDGVGPVYMPERPRRPPWARPRSCGPARPLSNW